MDLGGLVLHPVAVAVAGGAVGADRLDQHGPRVGGVVVGGEAGLQVGERSRTHAQVDQGDILLGDGLVVEGGLHGTELDRPSGEVEQNVGVMGQDLPDHARNRAHVLLGVVNVVQHVHRDQPPERAARDQLAGAPHAVLVDVVVARHAHQARGVGARRHLFDLGHRDAYRLFHQHVLAGRQRLQGELVVALQVGEHVHGVDGRVGEQIVGAVVARAAPGVRLLLGPRRGAVPHSHQPRPGAAPHRLRVQVGHYSGAEESDTQLFHVA